MRKFGRVGFSKIVSVAAVAGATVIATFAMAASTLPSAITRSFDFPVSLGSAISGTLVSPIGATPSLTFARGTVAVGALPMPLPQPLARLRQSRNQPAFFMPSNDRTPHARLLLNGVVDANGAPVSNHGNQLVIDAMVSPGSSASTLPPFVIPFDISNGMAFVDAALPINSGGSVVSVQFVGISVNDPSGQLFAVLGFQLAPVAPTATPFATQTPGGTPVPLGQCFVGPNCMGPSFPAPQDLCCHYTRATTAAPFATSWCPPNQFDPQTGQCAADTCVACGTSTDDCSSRTSCSGVCKLICADGHVVAGTCQGNQNCGCIGDCSAPATPTPAPTQMPGPCDSKATCGGTCPVTCADGTTATGECVLLLTPNQPRGPLCACQGTCPQPPTPTAGPNSCADQTVCGGPCTGVCADGTVTTGKCQPAIFNGPAILPGSPPILPIDFCQCVPQCSGPPTPTPTPGTCGTNGACVGTCTATCADGSTTIGTCVGLDANPSTGIAGPANACRCIAACGAPPPTPPLPHGTVCCQCSAAANKCFEISWVEVTPLCPAGCQTVPNGTCDPSTNGCIVPIPLQNGL